MEKLIPLLEKLAQSLGVGIERLWSALLEQAKISAAYHHQFIIMWLIAAIVIAILATLCLIGHFKDGYSDAGWMASAVGLYFCSAMFIVFMLVEKYEYMTAKYNAEYYAVKHILSYLSGK